MIKVSRSLKEINAKAYRVHEALFAERGREPGLEEIAEKIAVTREELVMAMEAGAQIESLQKMIYQGMEVELYWKIKSKNRKTDRRVF